MMEILGRRRITVLLSLLGTCVLLSGFYLALLLPQVSGSDRTLRTIRGDVAGMEEQTRSLKAAYEQFVANKPDYDRIEKVGFFNSQDRLKIRERFLEMKKETGVLNAKYEFAPAEIERFGQLDEAGYRMLKSEMNITIEAVDDLTVYAFLHKLVNDFPGRVNLVDVNIVREDKGLTRGLYEQIRTGVMPVLLFATVKAEWRSVVSADDIKGLIDDSLQEEQF